MTVQTDSTVQQKISGRMGTIKWLPAFLLATLAVVTLALSACSVPMHKGQSGDQVRSHDSMQSIPMHQAGLTGRSSADPFAEVSARMMLDMHSSPPSGDVDYDFVIGMIPHHQGAVAMSKILLESGQAESELALLAKEIIEAQSDEKIFLESWLSKNPEPKPNEEAVEIIQAYQASMMGMMGGMGMHDIRDVDINNRFIEGMIPHHQAAIKMAEVLLKYSNDAELRSMSQAVVREQTREITQMQNWLDQQ